MNLSSLQSICVIGSGPIVIGQACEFDYAGCQALKVLREDGYRTIVVNSNPATIMTDPGFADRTYIEPLDLEGVADVLRRERPDGLLPTLGGQTALNLAVGLESSGVLEELGVVLLGASIDASLLLARTDGVAVVFDDVHVYPNGFTFALGIIGNPMVVRDPMAHGPMGFGPRIHQRGRASGSSSPTERARRRPVLPSHPARRDPTRCS